MSEQPQESKPSVYSYHTLIFPFLWNNGGSVKREDFERCIDRAHWNLDLFDTYFDGQRANDLRKELYDQYQYFNAPARRAVYTLKDSQEEIVRNFRYKPEHFVKDAACPNYIITKGETRYSLHINTLRLKLYASGIGLLVYELENTDHRSIEDVNRINEYGRRIYCPFIFSTDNLTSSLTADSIRLEGACFPPAEDEEQWRVTADGRATDKMPRTKLARIVTMLLTNGRVSVTTNEDEAGGDKLYIEPIIDDRMFVACFVQDKDFANQLGLWNGSEYRWQADAMEKEPDAEDNLARQLYQFVFVDGESTSCVNRTMLRSLLEKHVYSRWAEFGTFHGITEYSMVCLSSADEDYLVKNPFLIQYIELAMLALAQRASLIAFERQISHVSGDYKKARELMEASVRFQSQLLLPEVTPQQQGIELYDMLVENLYINQHKDQVENRIRNLFELKNFRSEWIENRILLAIAILGGVQIVDVILRWLGVIN